MSFVELHFVKLHLTSKVIFTFDSWFLLILRSSPSASVVFWYIWLLLRFWPTYGREPFIDRLTAWGKIWRKIGVMLEWWCFRLFNHLSYYTSSGIPNISELFHAVIKALFFVEKMTKSLHSCSKRVFGKYSIDV